MTTVLISKIGDYKATIIRIPFMKEKQECLYIFVEKDKKFKTENGAIRNARVYLKKKRATYIPKIKRKRLKPIKIKRRRLK